MKIIIIWNLGKIPIFSHKISDGKKGGPLSKINNGRTKSKNNLVFG